MPSQALEEDADLVMTIMEMRSYARAKEIIERESTSEEDARRAGVTEERIEQVMANIERMLNAP